MPKQSKPLTAKQIDKAKPKETDYSIPDGGGLGLLVTSKGTKLWRMRPRFDGKYIVLSFGEYPHVTLEQARRKRDEVKKQIAEGIDPREAKREQSRQKQEEDAVNALDAEYTFRNIALRLHASKQGRTTDYYRNKMLRQFEIHLFPVVGEKNVRDIEGKELFDIFKGIAEKKNKEGKSMTYMAKKLCQWTAEVYDLANVENSGFALNNPCRSIIKFLPKHETEHMARIEFADLPHFIQALEAYGGHILTKSAVWMLLYTGMRQTSIRRATWSDFDLEAGIWKRKPEKTDKAIHEIPLPEQAIKLLNEINRLTGGHPDNLVFPSIYENKLQMSEAAVGQAIERMGFAMTGHGLRGVVSTGLNELGFNPRLVEVQLGHKKSDAIEAAYNDAKHFSGRRKMMQNWADYLESLKTGKIVTFKVA